MPWVKATLRGQSVFAKADERGELASSGGRVEIRYKPTDGRAYHARADNLEVTDRKVLPDDTCASAVAEPAKAGAAGSDTGSRMPGRSAAKAAGPPPAPKDAIVVYADGACSGNPGPCGAGVVLIDGGRRVEISEYLGVGTNNIAELTAVLRALKEAPLEKAMMIYTDSQYTIGVVQKGWKAKANQELVASLRAALAARPSARLAYVPGHSGVILNERADALAREAVTSRSTRRAEMP